MSYCVLLFELTACHTVGDYVLQNDFLARTKGENWWHLLVHCVLYVVPFAAIFGIDQRIFWLFSSHALIDAMKARWKVIGYASDQIAHVVMMLALYLTEAGA